MTKKIEKNYVHSYKKYLRSKIDKEQLNKPEIDVLGDGMVDHYYLTVFRFDDRLWMINQVFGEEGGFNVA